MCCGSKPKLFTQPVWLASVLLASNEFCTKNVVVWLTSCLDRNGRRETLEQGVIPTTTTHISFQFAHKYSLWISPFCIQIAESLLRCCIKLHATNLWNVRNKIQRFYRDDHNSPRQWLSTMVGDSKLLWKVIKQMRTHITVLMKASAKANIDHVEAGNHVMSLRFDFLFLFLFFSGNLPALPRGLFKVKKWSITIYWNSAFFLILSVCPHVFPRDRIGK